MDLLPLSDVRLLDGPFRAAQQTDLAYLLRHDPQRLLAPYRREAGLPRVAEPYGNWESMGLDGHVGGHALSAASLLWAATGDERAARFAADLVDGLAVCQDALGTGYVGGVPHGVALFERIAAGDLSADSFGLNGAWVPWYNLHKTVAGLVDAARYAPEPTASRARDVAVRFADWWLPVAAGLDDDQFAAMLRTEFGGMCEAFADLADLTGRSDLRAMAVRFADRTLLDPLLDGRDALDGLHANTQIAKVVGWAALAESAPDGGWDRAARAFADSVVRRRSLVFGGDSVSEHFHPVDDFRGALTSPEGPESCNTANMLELVRRLLRTDPDPVLLDFAERALVNHVLSAQHPDGGFVYFTPARPDHYRVYSQPEVGFWCCVGTGLETYARLGELALGTQPAAAPDEGDDLLVNVAVPVRARWAARGAVVTLTSDLPDLSTGGEVTLRLDLPATQTFTVHVRRPSWAVGDLELAVGGVRVPVEPGPGPYVAVRRTWDDGDLLTWRVTARVEAERLPDGSDWAAFRYGPVVLAARGGTDDLPGLRADGSRMGHVASGPLHALAGAPVVESAADGADQVHGPLDGMTFRLDTDRGPLALEPFHALHDARYTLYFPLAAPGTASERRAALAAAESDDLSLAARTVDDVACGRQQPEVEHAFTGDGTWTGATDGVRWRAADGWFGYVLADPAASADVLRVTLRGGDVDGAADVVVDGTRVGTVTAPAGAGLRHVELDLAPATGAASDAGGGPAVGDGRAVAAPGSQGRSVRVQAVGGGRTPRVVGLRLLRR
ncbi:glycoside hydrolase family 127 protein [Cellulomonas fimi]|uniref:beta-L-arabinofuranosidase domain-containing protein n=1 Tax=Cellulomonas fimi TaxID=1708 RepID=UPI00234C9B7C|nr:beta-L-arabinofuranosidase domain-containing protein [Cellulomonas fimi]MDC7121998.1 glycoside hydrolase family 127 protein [Cellulomonas fimi]